MEKCLDCNNLETRMEGHLTSWVCGCETNKYFEFKYADICDHDCRDFWQKTWDRPYTTNKEFADRGRG